MSPMTLSVLLSSLALGTMITLSSTHWLLAWMGLEINTLAIIPLMSQLHHPRAVEASTKYFLTQATASALVLFSSMNNAWVLGEWNITELENPLSIITMTIALSMKLGLAPLHFWLPEVLQGLNLTTGLILSTWQKLAPLALIYQIYPNLNVSLLMLFAISSTLMGGWGGLNQTQLRKIMAYSSIAHLGWMMIVLILMPKLMVLNLSIYLLLTSTMFLIMITLTTTKISSLAISWSKTPTLTALASMTLLSLGGLPPFSGFLPKWLILQELTKHNMGVIASIMAFSTLLSLFFYLRLTYNLTLTISPNLTNAPLTWNFHYNYKIVLPLTMMLSITLLPLSPAIISLLL
uniref:NADH-ubiquinone oxidoreductase chain 2 n=5 Tax=Ascaphus TaxID=8438 RepID=Q2HQU7_ASCTR|nr:NADH dehydrogenase subunit 2 [Ascaphus truei]